MIFTTEMRPVQVYSEWFVFYYSNKHDLYSSDTISYRIGTGVFNMIRILLQ